MLIHAEKEQLITIIIGVYVCMYACLQVQSHNGSASNHAPTIVVSEKQQQLGLSSSSGSSSSTMATGDTGGHVAVSCRANEGKINGLRSDGWNSERSNNVSLGGVFICC
uniref:Uncharacterized protein n=1 Tax=Caenorhabditis japonica TaxID=281687 RepID=A0A8R1IHL3_CAEJA